MVALLNKISNATLEQICLSRKPNSQALQSCNLNVSWKLNVANALVERIPILAVVVGKAERLSNQAVQLLSRSH